jgi:hypothetical protein
MLILAQIAYESSLRALDKQERVLEEIRARTAVLLAASSLAASLLGHSALDEPHAVALLVGVLLAFAVSTGASIYVLLPRPDIVFAVNGPAVYEGLYGLQDGPETYRRLAHALDRIDDANEDRVHPLVVAVRAAAISLVIEIVGLTLMVSSTL